MEKDDKQQGGNPFQAFESFARGFSGAWSAHAANSAKMGSAMAKEQMAFIGRQSAMAADSFQKAMACRTPEDFAALALDAAKNQSLLAFDQAERMMDMVASMGGGDLPSVVAASSIAKAGLETARKTTLETLEKAAATLKK